MMSGSYAASGQMRTNLAGLHPVQKKQVVYIIAVLRILSVGCTYLYPATASKV